MDLERFKRYDVRLWLVFFAATLPLFPSTAWAAEGILEKDSNAILMALIGVLGSMIVLLGGIVAVVKSLLKTRSPAVRDSNTLAQIEKTFEKMLKDHEDREQDQFAEIHRRIDAFLNSQAVGRRS